MPFNIGSLRLVTRLTVNVRKHHRANTRSDVLIESQHDQMGPDSIAKSSSLDRLPDGRLSVRLHVRAVRVSLQHNALRRYEFDPSIVVER
jgi:hypothetical protein